jgi:hypothetical protein
MIPLPLRARTPELGRAAARRHLDQALAVLDAWYDEARIRVCVVCLGLFIRPVRGRQGARIYCSAACRQLAYRLRRPSRPRPDHAPLPLLDSPEPAA